MSNITKTMMSLELEFIEPTAHGFINWINSNGQSLATLGLGSTAITIDNNGNETNTNGPKYLEWNLIGVDYIKITGGGIQFDEQRSLSIDSVKPIYNEYNEVSGEENYISSQIHLNNANYLDISKFEPANIIHTEGARFNELQKIKTNYKSKTNAMIFEHENDIAFTNPVSKRLIGHIDTINEAFIWYGSFSLGSIVEDSYFEIKRVDSKFNLTLNATTNKNPELVFKYENLPIWFINVISNNLNLKNIDGNGIELNNNSVIFSGEIIYNNKPLLEYFYTQEQLNEGVLDERYYTQEQLNEGILDERYYTQEQSDNNYYYKSEIDEEINKIKQAIGEIDLHDIYNKVYKNTIYFIYDINETKWIKIMPKIFDEFYDINNQSDKDGLFYVEKEDRYYIHKFNNWTIISLTTISTLNLPKVYTDNDYVFSYIYNRIYKYNTSLNNWVETNLNVNDFYIEIQHKSDIIEPINDKIYKINSTNKYYKYTDNIFIKIENPLPYVYSLPNQYNINNILKYTFI